nr:MAG TPA: hypothetical protein [Caudoviricetes sp.]
MIRIYHYFCIKAKNMFENFASIMNKASVQNEKSNILNGLKLPIIAVFLLGVVLISFALITTNTIFSYILLGCGLAVMVIGLPILICVYLHFYTRSYNENPMQLYSEKFNNDQAVIKIFGERGTEANLRLPESQYLYDTNEHKKEEGIQ